MNNGGWFPKDVVRRVLSQVLLNGQSMIYQIASKPRRLQQFHLLEELRLHKIYSVSVKRYHYLNFHILINGSALRQIDLVTKNSVLLALRTVMLVHFVFFLKFLRIRKPYFLKLSCLPIHILKDFENASL